jgi:SP family sugar:H+ symporter-like MFS transporter
MGIMLATIVFSAGVAFQIAAAAFPLFIAGRVLAGVGVGLISTLVPMYQSECAPKWIRGTVVAAYQWAITIGLLLANVVNNATQARSDASAYRIPIGIQFVWAAVLAGGMAALPEVCVPPRRGRIICVLTAVQSPRWLVKKHRDVAAGRALARLTSLAPDSPDVELELNQIRAAVAAQEALGSASYADCFRATPNKIRLRTFTAIAVQALQQLSGVNFIFYYGTTFFQQAGVKNAFLVSVATGVVNVVCSLPGMWGVERYGRRKLLLLGAAGMCASELLVAAIGISVGADNKAGQQAIIAFACIYIGFFAATWGPIAWVVTGEVFPLAVRAKGVSLAAASNWIWNFAIGYASASFHISMPCRPWLTTILRAAPYLINSGPGNAGLGVRVYFIWGGVCALCFAFAFACVPETKGLSLEQIDVLYRNSTPLASGELRKRLLAAELRGHANAQDAALGEDAEKHDVREAFEDQVQGARKQHVESI